MQVHFPFEQTWSLGQMVPPSQVQPPPVHVSPRGAQERQALPLVPQKSGDAT
jgi:hypothetical protein